MDDASTCHNAHIADSPPRFKSLAERLSLLHENEDETGNNYQENIAPVINRINEMNPIEMAEADENRRPNARADGKIPARRNTGSYEKDKLKLMSESQRLIRENDTVELKYKPKQCQTMREFTQMLQERRNKGTAPAATEAVNGVAKRSAVAEDRMCDVPAASETVDGVAERSAVVEENQARNCAAPPAETMTSETVLAPHTADTAPGDIAPLRQRIALDPTISRQMDATHKLDLLLRHKYGPGGDGGLIELRSADRARSDRQQAEALRDRLRKNLAGGMSQRQREVVDFLVHEGSAAGGRTHRIAVTHKVKCVTLAGEIDPLLSKGVDDLLPDQERARRAALSDRQKWNEHRTLLLAAQGEKCRATRQDRLAKDDFAAAVDGAAGDAQATGKAGANDGLSDDDYEWSEGRHGDGSDLSGSDSDDVDLDGHDKAVAGDEEGLDSDEADEQEERAATKRGRRKARVISDEDDDERLHAASGIAGAEARNPSGRAMFAEFYDQSFFDIAPVASLGQKLAATDEFPVEKDWFDESLELTLSTTSLSNCSAMLNQSSRLSVDGALDDTAAACGPTMPLDDATMPLDDTYSAVQSLTAVMPSGMVADLSTESIESAQLHSMRRKLFAGDNDVSCHPPNTMKLVADDAFQALTLLLASQKDDADVVEAQEQDTVVIDDVEEDVQEQEEEGHGGEEDVQEQGEEDAPIDIDDVVLDDSDGSGDSSDEDQAVDGGDNNSETDEEVAVAKKVSRLYDSSSSGGDVSEDDGRVESEGEEEDDNDEEEVLRLRETAGTKRLAGREFLDEEAELSGSDADEYGPDEDEDGLDAYEEETGDAELLPSEGRLRRQVERIHNRMEIDKDARDVRLLQEIFLEDGDMHLAGGRRTKRFTWATMDDGDDGAVPPAGDDDDDAMADDSALLADHEDCAPLAGDDGAAVDEVEASLLQQYGQLLDRPKWHRGALRHNDDNCHSRPAWRTDLATGPSTDGSPATRKYGSFMHRPAADNLPAALTTARQTGSLKSRMQQHTFAVGDKASKRSSECVGDALPQKKRKGDSPP